MSNLNNYKYCTPTFPLQDVTAHDKKQADEVEKSCQEVTPVPVLLTYGDSLDDTTILTRYGILMHTCWSHHIIKEPQNANKLCSYDAQRWKVWYLSEVKP